MTPLLTALIVGLAAAGIFALRPVTAKIKTVLNQNLVVDFQIKFQSLQLVLAAVVLLLVYFLNPENFAHFFRMGNVNAHISKIAWLGVTGNETWLEIATSIGLYITIGTGTFMFFQLKKLAWTIATFCSACSGQFYFQWRMPFQKKQFSESGSSRRCMEFSPSPSLS
jgi:hypothetical protein